MEPRDALQAWIVRAMNLAHTTFADGRDDLVRSEFVAYRKRHLSKSAKFNRSGRK
jgi:hypothetical protein